MSNYDLLNKVMWETYNDVKKSDFKMDGLETHKKLEILKNFLLPYFIKHEEYEICNELKKQIELIKQMEKIEKFNQIIDEVFINYCQTKMSQQLSEYKYFKKLKNQNTYK